MSECRVHEVKRRQGSPCPGRGPKALFTLSRKVRRQWQVVQDAGPNGHGPHPRVSIGVSEGISGRLPSCAPWALSARASPDRCRAGWHRLSTAAPWSCRRPVARGSTRSPSGWRSAPSSFFVELPRRPRVAEVRRRWRRPRKKQTAYTSGPAQRLASASGVGASAASLPVRAQDRQKRRFSAAVSLASFRPCSAGRLRRAGAPAFRCQSWSSGCGEFCAPSDCTVPSSACSAATRACASWRATSRIASSSSGVRSGCMACEVFMEFLFVIDQSATSCRNQK